MEVNLQTQSIDKITIKAKYFTYKTRINRYI
jgi:superoxide dismutase